MSSSRWICNAAQSGRPLTLICFPWAGGGCATFYDWPSGLPGWIDVRSVLLPGRERRLRESPFYHIDQLLDSLIPALEPLLQKPYALFGHSVGALISFELLRRLRSMGSKMAVHLFVSGHSAPQVPISGVQIHNLPVKEFKEELSRLAGTPREVLNSPEWFEAVSPSVRGDLSMAETYQYAAGCPLDVPITAFGGSEDRETTVEGINAWISQTTQSFCMHMMPGGHFFLRSERSAIWKIIADQLSRHSCAVIPGLTF